MNNWKIDKYFQFFLLPYKKNFLFLFYNKLMDYDLLALLHRVSLTFKSDISESTRRLRAKRAKRDRGIG